MNTSNSPHLMTNHGATSVVSLIAITAGTVSAALLIMFVGLFLTMMSMVSTAQTTASMTVNKHDTMRVAVASEAMVMHDAQRHQKHKKGHLMDALLRDDNTHSDVSSEHQAQLATRTARIYAISATPTFFSHDPHLVQI